MRFIIFTTLISLTISICGFGINPEKNPIEPTGQGTRALPPAATATLTPSPPPTLAPTPTLFLDSRQQQKAAMLPEYEADTAVLQGATEYVLDVSVQYDGDGSQANMEGTARIIFTNNQAERIESIPVMLWPNDEQYRGSMQVGPALIDGHMVVGEKELGGLAVRYQLPTALTAGSSADMTVPFRVMAEGPIGGESPHRFGITEGVLFAPTFYPLIPRRVQGQWEVKDAPRGGDTTNSLVASYTVSLEVPADLVLVATGTEIDRQEVGGDRVQIQFVSGPVRDFAFALGNLQGDKEIVDGVEIHVWVLASHQTDFDRVMNSATRQLELLNELVGPYPYEELDIVDVPGAYGGIEYPGLVTIGTLGTSWIVEPVVHEVAHQWFYGLIGDDQVEEPWIDEAFATYATAMYYENAVSSGRATGYLSDFRDILRNHQEPGRPIGLGVDQYDRQDYSLFVYLKGALFYQELRQRMGERAFFDFLQSFYQENRYGFVTAKQYQAAAETSCDCQLDALFDLWVFEGGELTFP